MTHLEQARAAYSADRARRRALASGQREARDAIAQMRRDAIAAAQDKADAERLAALMAPALAEYAAGIKRLRALRREARKARAA